jgi:2-iminobutanoate/2-iminopropanoate deaminase
MSKDLNLTIDGAKRGIIVAGAPAPSGHYSHAVVANGLVFVAGQLPLDPSTREIPVGAEAQTRLALANCAMILKAAGSSLDDVVNTTVFVTDIGHWPAVNAVWSETFTNFRPARTVAVSHELHFGCLVEIQVTAVLSAGAASSEPPNSHSAGRVRPVAPEALA